jgi:hypothetical protein
VKAGSKTTRSRAGAVIAAIAGRKRPFIPVDDEQRRHLVEDCAFFRAARFRAAEPGCFREQDLKAAAADIDAALNPLRTRRKKRRV